MHNSVMELASFVPIDISEPASATADNHAGNLCSTS